MSWHIVAKRLPERKISPHTFCKSEFKSPGRSAMIRSIERAIHGAAQRLHPLEKVWRLELRNMQKDSRSSGRLLLVRAWNGQKLISESQMQGGILNRLFDFLKTATKPYLLTNRDAILLENRPKLYLGKEERVLEIKRKCASENEQWREYPTERKPPHMTFLESFPDIS